MKPVGLFVLTFYHILLRFSTKAAVNKPQQNRNSCHQNRNKPRILLPVRDILVPFGLDMVGERHCLSKARSNFDCAEKCFLQQNSCASLVGRPLTDCALLSLFFGAPKGTNVPKSYRFRWGFVSVPFGYRQETVRQLCLLIPAVKVYNGGKKFWRKNQNENSSHLCALQ